MTVSEASGRSEAAQQTSLSLAQSLVLIPPEDRMRPHDELAAIVSSDLPFPDPLFRIVFGYSVSPFEIDPKELVGRVCLTPPRVPSEVHYFFLRTDNILPLFQKILRVGEELGCRETMVETIRTASLTTYSAQVPKQKYPGGAAAHFRAWGKDFPGTFAHSFGMQVWELNLSSYLGNQVGIDELIAKRVPMPDRNVKYPYPNTGELHALLKQEKIPITSYTLLGVAMRFGDDEETLERPNFRVVPISVDNVHLYEAENPIAAEMGGGGDCWWNARLAIKDWDPCLRSIAEFFIGLAEWICCFFCGEREEI